MPVTAVANSQPAAVIDAMRSIQNEGDRWNLADELKVLIPTGNGIGPITFGSILDQATAEGVAGKLSVNTLRLYRDTAARWEASKRVPNVSFSAHREAMVLDTVDQAVKMLTDLAKVNGPDKVTVASVRKAVALKQGRATAAAKATKAAPSATIGDVLTDLRQNGGGKVIAAIGTETAPDALDELFDGLNKVVAHVEKQRAKAARKAATAAKGTAAAAAKANPTPKAAAPKAAAKGAGDMRGL